MTTESQQTRRPSRPRLRLQFTMRTLLGAIVVLSTVFAAAQMVDPAFAGALVVWAIFGGLYLRFRAYIPLVALCVGPAIGIVPSALIIFFWWPLAGIPELGPDPAELVCWPLAWAVVLSVLVGVVSAVRRWIASRARRSADQPTATSGTGPRQTPTWSALKWAIALTSIHTVVCVGVALFFFFVLARQWPSPDEYLLMLFLGAMTALDLPIICIPLLHETSPIPLVTLLLVVFGGVLYAGLGWVIGYFADCVRSKGVRVLVWCVGVSAAALALAAIVQERRFAAVRQRQSALDALDDFRSQCTGRWDWPWSITSTIMAAKSEKAVLQALRNLDEQDGIIRRYGRLQALQGAGHCRKYGGFFFSRSCLLLPRILVFEKAEARVNIRVRRGPIVRVQIKMFPTQEYVEDHPESRLEIVGSEMVYVGPSDVEEPVDVDEPAGSQIESVIPDVRWKSRIDIQVDHPEFRGG